MCAYIRSDNVHLCRRKVIIPGVLQHFRPGWKDQTKSRGRTHTNIDTHKYTQTYIHIYACTPPISCCLFISPASAVASRLDSVYRETRDKREHCSAFYLHQVIRRMQLASSIRINTPVCVCGCVRKCVCVCVRTFRGQLECLCAIRDRLYGMHLGWPDVETRRGRDGGC